MQPDEVIIVGGGIAGLATAWHLARAGRTRIRVLEREWACGSHASGLNAAIFRHLDFDEAAVGLSLRSRALMDTLAPGLVRTTGALYLAAEPRLRPAVDLLGRRGVAAQWLSAEAAAARFPMLAPSSRLPAAFVPDDGVIDLHGLLAALQRDLRSAGVAVRTGVTVTGLRHAGGVHQVELQGGEVVTAEQAVLAGGAWSAELAQRSGLTLPIEPRRRHLALLEPDVAVSPSHPVVWRLDEEVYFRPESGGVLASPCDEERCAPDLCAVAPEQIGRLAPLLAGLAPDLSTARVRRAWSCLRSFAPDREFVAGADPRRPGLHWLAGLGGRGMTCGLALGEVVAAAVLGRPHALGQSLSPGRLV